MTIIMTMTRATVIVGLMSLSFVCLFSPVSALLRSEDQLISDYQQDQVMDRNINQETTKTLYDENGKLSNHHLVFPAEMKNCPAIANFIPYYKPFQRSALTGTARDITFPGYTSGDCVAACLEQGTDRSVAGHTMPYLHYDATVHGYNFDEWFGTHCNKMEVCIMNYYNSEHPLTVNWIHEKTGQPQLHNYLEYGEKKTRCFESYLGHSFEVHDVKDGNIGQFTVHHTMVQAFGTSPPSDEAEHHNFEKEIQQTLKIEWDRHNRVKRTFSPLGFDKGKLPPDVFASMGSFFYNNQNKVVREEWKGKGVYVNWWESNVSFIQIPWDLKAKWQVRLADMVSEWAGVPVEQTVMYGLRQYEHGARLLTHVDRTATHAVSLIVNIAQGNMTEPWPVEVFDHADRLHEVLMEPGEVVYYESAKNLHSRNRPLKGGYYVNLFTHYRPIGDGDRWYTKLDQPGVPTPVLEDDIVGSCRLESVATAGTAAGQLGIVQQVHCDDPRLGLYISPTFFQAKSSDDLVEWWRRTGPNYKEDNNNHNAAAADDDGNSNDGVMSSDTPDGNASTQTNDEL